MSVIVETCFPWNSSKVQPLTLYASVPLVATTPDSVTGISGVQVGFGPATNPPVPLFTGAARTDPFVPPSLVPFDVQPFKVPRNSVLMITAWEWSGVVFPDIAPSSPIAWGAFTPASWAVAVAAAPFLQYLTPGNAAYTRPLSATLVDVTGAELVANNLFGPPGRITEERLIVPGTLAAVSDAGLALKFDGVLGGAPNSLPLPDATLAPVPGGQVIYTLRGFLVLDRDILDSPRGQVVT